MSELPPQGQSNYPRQRMTLNYGSADKLQALSDGYYGLNVVFFINFLIVIAETVAYYSQQSLLALGILIILFITTAVLSFSPNRKIAIGKNWDPSAAILASFLTALFCWLCFGAFGYIVMQMIALNEMKKYGLKTGFGGIKKPVIRAAIDELRSIEASQPPSAPGFSIPGT